MLFGTSGTARSLLSDDSSDLGVAGMRLLLGALPLWAYAWFRHRDSFRRPGPLVVVAGVAMAAFQVFFFQSVSAAGVAIGTMLTIGSGPVIAACIEYATSRTVPRGVPVGIALAVTGLVLLVMGSPGSDGAAVSVAGIVAGLAAGACYAGYTHVSKTLLGHGWSGAWVMAQSFGVSAIVGVALVGFSPMGWLSTPGSWATVAYLGIATIAVPYVLYAAALVHLPSSTVVTLTLVEPVTATILGAFVLDEAIGAGSWIGACIVISGLVHTGRMAAAR
jgi:DME family drug/metabolite transporter